MALSALSTWEVRTTGVDTNGGGYVTGSSGTDFSQQDAAQYGAANLAVDSVTNTKVTSAAHSFVATDVGNLLQVTAGAGFTLGFYQILSVTGGAATLDRSPAATSTTGGTYAVGGALLTISKLNSNLVAGNTAWIKAGTYTVSASIAWTTTGTATAPIRLRGYTTTRGDSSTKPLITTATNSTPLWTLASAACIEWRNLRFTNTAGVRSSGISGITTAGTGFWLFTDCVLDGFTSGMDTSSRGPSTYVAFVRALVQNCTSHGATEGGVPLIVLIDSVFYNNSGDGFRSAPSATCVVRRCIFANNTANGLADQGTTRTMSYFLIGNTFVSNGAAGFKSAETTTSPNVVTENNIFYGNTTFGQDYAFVGGVDKTVIGSNNNAYGSNSSGPLNGVSAGVSDVTLSADPFTAKASQDWTLNTTAGGGAACRAAGFPGAMQLGGTGYLDIGALQHQDSGGAAGMLYIPNLDGV